MDLNRFDQQIPRPTGQRTASYLGWRLLIVVALVSLFVGGVTGGLVGGGATFLVMTLNEQDAPPPLSTDEPVPISSEPVYSIVETGDAVVAVVQSIGPTVVTVVNQMESPGAFYEPPSARGSGVIVDPQGYIVTNHHVVENAAELTVIFADGTSKPARLVGHDFPFSDLAVIKVEGDDYPYAPLGDASALQVGEPVVAIGSALGDFRNTVTTGVISGMGRALKVSEDLILEGMLQTDAAINQGNSGGPLSNLDGEVIGINTAIIRGSGYSSTTAEGIGFAIPSDIVSYVVEQLITQGKVARPYLGVRTIPVTPQMAAYYSLPVDHGVYVIEVLSGTPAAQAGLLHNDIIVSIGGDALDEDHPLINVLSRYETGQQVTVEINRDGETLDLELVLGERP